jgi:hypothetical protein
MHRSVQCIYCRYRNSIYVFGLRSLIVSNLREYHRLRVFENRVFRRIFGPKRNEVTGG